MSEWVIQALILMFMGFAFAVGAGFLRTISVSAGWLALIWSFLIFALGVGYLLKGVLV